MFHRVTFHLQYIQLNSVVFSQALLQVFRVIKDTLNAFDDFENKQQKCMTVYNYHATYEFQSESTLIQSNAPYR